MAELKAAQFCDATYIVLVAKNISAKIMSVNITT